MSGSYLNPTQQMRVRQVGRQHQHLKELNLATEEAVRCHDKYVAALEKVMSCLLDNTDVLEEVRQTSGPEGAASVVPTAPITGQLVSAFTNWKMSHELDALRSELEALRVLSTEGRHTTKTTKLLSESVERSARKCAYVNSPEYQAKMAHQSGRARDKMVSEAREENGKLVQQDMNLYQKLMSTSGWWSNKLACRTSELYRAFSQLAQRTAAAFPPSYYYPPPCATAAAATTAFRSSPRSTECAADGSCGVPSAEPTYDIPVSAVPVSMDSAPTSVISAGGGAYATGVPLEFHGQDSTKSVP